MKGVIVTLNAGSSSVKAAAFASTQAGLEEKPLLHGEISGLDSAPVLSLRVGDGPKRETRHDDMAGDHAAAIAALLDAIRSQAPENVAAVGHRIVHGGPAYSAPQTLTPEVTAALARLSPLAPGHQPHNLVGVDGAMRCWPAALQVGCFDTAFHRTQPAVAERFALPRDLAAQEGLIRYGFHGLSYDYIASAAPQIMGAPARRVIVAHLGAGASMCALLDGESVATTMGFSALD
ncbi:MAG: acetate kinase, partial [Oricola sp.]|nr:acetate kinase [Oricola sp.]